MLIIRLFVNFLLIQLVLLFISCGPSSKEKEGRRIMDSIRCSDSIIIAKAERLGIWEVCYFIDEFKEKTKNKYISNSKPILGTFSNSAVEDSKLSVDFIIENQNNITLQLYEYDGTNPVKKKYDSYYSVSVKSNDGDITNLTATNFSDRLSLDSTDSKTLSDIFIKGGKIKFSIDEISEY